LIVINIITIAAEFQL